MLVLLCPARRQPATARLQPSSPTRAFFAICKMPWWSWLLKSPVIVKMPPMTALSCTRKCDNFLAPPCNARKSARSRTSDRWTASARW